MHELRKKRIFALIIGTGLIVVPLVLLWRETSFFLQYWPFIPLILTLIPGTVGAMVGAWIRGGSKHPWLRASGFGVIVWWSLLLIAFLALFIWLVATIPPPDPGAEATSAFHQPGYGHGLLAGFALIYGLAYAVVGLPFILLGAVLTYPRRGVAC